MFVLQFLLVITGFCGLGYGLYLVLFSFIGLAFPNRVHYWKKERNRIEVFSVYLVGGFILTFGGGGLMLNAADSAKNTRLDHEKEEASVVSRISWNIESDPSLNTEEKSFVKAAAENVLKHEPDCDKIQMGGQSTSKTGSYYVQCTYTGGQPFNVYFTKEDAQKQRLLKAPEPYADAYDLCIAQISQSMNYPSTVDTDMFDLSVDERPDGNTFIMQGFSAKNGFGVEQHFRAYCHVSPEGDIQFQLDR